MRTVMLIIWVLLLSRTAFPQQRVSAKKNGWWPALEMGYLRQEHQHRMEFGYSHHRIRIWTVVKDSADEKLATLSWGPTASLVGFVNEGNTFRMGQQIGFSMVYNNAEAFIPLGLKGGVYLENYTKHDQRISFAGGPLIGGIVHCQYGYSIPFGKQTLPGIGRHRLGLFIYLNSLGPVDFFERTPMM